MTTHVLILDPDPAMLVSTNRRLHHMQRAQVCKYWRELAYWAAIAEPVELDKARIEMWCRFPTRRRRDVSNLYTFVAKPIVDGLVDAGVVPDDDDAHLVGPDLRRERPNGPVRVTVRIEECAP